MPLFGNVERTQDTQGDSEKEHGENALDRQRGDGEGRQEVLAPRAVTSDQVIQSAIDKVAGDPRKLQGIEKNAPLGLVEKCGKNKIAQESRRASEDVEEQHKERIAEQFGHRRGGTSARAGEPQQFARLGVAGRWCWTTGFWATGVWLRISHSGIVLWPVEKHSGNE